MYYDIIHMLYRMKRLTAAQVWAKADEGIITAEEAARICGARPADSAE